MLLNLNLTRRWRRHDHARVDAYSRRRPCHAGDRELGLKSLPVAFGIDGAKYICAGLIDVTQIAVAAYLFAIGLQTYALVLGLLIAPQIWAQTQYLPVWKSTSASGAPTILH